MTDNFSTPGTTARGTSGRPGPKGVWALVALLAAAMVAALIVVISGVPGSGPRPALAATAPPATATAPPVVIRTEAADVVGDQPFVDPNQAAPIVLDGPASPGTGDLGACDPDRLVSYLQSHDAAAAAWVRALDVDPTLHWSGGPQVTVDQIADYVHQLNAVKLGQDTRVTNYFFQNGTAVPFQSVLVNGTAVLVDQDGIPRVRCACGNPLNPPVIALPPVHSPCDRTPEGCPQLPPPSCDRERDSCPTPCDWDHDRDHCPNPCDRDDRLGCPNPCDWDHDRSGCPPPCDLRDDRRNCLPTTCPRGADCPPPCELTHEGCSPRPVCPAAGCTPPVVVPTPAPSPTDPPIRIVRPPVTSTGPESTGGATAEPGSRGGHVLRPTRELDVQPAHDFGSAGPERSESFRSSPTTHGRS